MQPLRVQERGGGRDSEHEATGSNLKDLRKHHSRRMSSSALLTSSSGQMLSDSDGEDDLLARFESALSSNGVTGDAGSPIGFINESPGTPSSDTRGKDSSDTGGKDSSDTGGKDSARSRTETATAHKAELSGLPSRMKRPSRRNSTHA